MKTVAQKTALRVAREVLEFLSEGKHPQLKTEIERHSKVCSEGKYPEIRVNRFLSLCMDKFEEHALEVSRATKMLE